MGDTHDKCIGLEGCTGSIWSRSYLRTASFLGSRALAVCCIWPILLWSTQTLWLVLTMSFSSSWNKEQACRAKSDSCRKVRDSTTLLMAHRSSKSTPSSLGIWCLHRSCGSTIRLAKGILSKDKPAVKSQRLRKLQRAKETTSKCVNPTENALMLSSTGVNPKFPSSPWDPPSRCCQSCFLFQLLL